MRLFNGLRPFLCIIVVGLGGVLTMTQDSTAHDSSFASIESVSRDRPSHFETSHFERGGRGRGRGLGRRRAPEHRRRDWIPHPHARRQDAVSESLRDLWAEEASQFRCEQLNELFVRVTRRMFQTQAWIKAPQEDRRAPPGFRRGGRITDSEVHRRKWQKHIQSREWWEGFWRSLADAYRACEVDCFEEGQVVGQISALGYCSLSEALGGLTGPGFTSQGVLPVCETSTYAGCLQAYQSTASSMDSCSRYTTGEFAPVFSEFMSQDCLLEQSEAPRS